MKKLKVLIIDDAKAVRSVIRIVFSGKFPIQIVEADNGHYAQTILNSQSIDLILCDWDMPEMNGYELLLWVKSDERFKRIPFIMITGNTDKNKVINALSAGIDSYLVKPFDIDVLVKRVKEVMTKRGINL